MCDKECTQAATIVGKVAFTSYLVKEVQPFNQNTLIMVHQGTTTCEWRGPSFRSNVNSAEEILLTVLGNYENNLSTLKYAAGPNEFKERHKLSGKHANCCGILLTIQIPYVLS